MIRFNKSGKFNVPYNHKPNRFSKSYITKIVNQVRNVYDLCRMSNWEFITQSFEKTLKEVDENDFVYCDPPYIDRHVDYYNNWNSDNELILYKILKNIKVDFILSTWHHNKYRKNVYIDTLWNDPNFSITTKEHFYHVGAKELNRNSITEALVLNYCSNGEINYNCDFSQLELINISNKIF